MPMGASAEESHRHLRVDRERTSFAFSVAGLLESIRLKSIHMTSLPSRILGR